MAEHIRHLWLFRALFVALALLVIFVQLLPFHPGPGKIPGPDVLLLLALSWVLLRQEFVPLLVVALLFLAADILFVRPFGLWAALAVVGTEYLRHRSFQMREVSFLVEWLTIAAIVTAMTLLYALAQSLFAVQQPPLGMTLIRLFFTIICYPLVVVLGGRLFGLRKPRAGETDSMGLRV